jgi:hypothetical protein
VKVDHLLNGKRRKILAGLPEVIRVTELSDDRISGPGVMLWLKSTVSHCRQINKLKNLINFLMVGD